MLNKKTLNVPVWIFSMKYRFGVTDQPQKQKELVDESEFDAMYDDERKVSEK